MQTTNKINIILGYDLGKSSLTTPTPGKIAAVFIRTDAHFKCRRIRK
jgi:hypothetical protein